MAHRFNYILKPMEVLYADYKRQHSIDVIKQELIPNLNKIKIEVVLEDAKLAMKRNNGKNSWQHWFKMFLFL